MMVVSVADLGLETRLEESIIHYLALTDFDYHR
jgi:hypothetical protein